MDKLLIAIREFLTLRLILLLGLFVRLGVLIFYPDQNFPDAQGYINSGKSFFETGLISSPFHMPLYIIWTHLMGGGFWLKLTDILFSLVSIWLIYLVSLEIFGDKLSAQINAFIASLYPHFLFYATSRLTETSFVMFILFAFLMLYREKYLWASALLVFSILIRPTFDLLNPLLVFVFAWIVHKRTFTFSLKKTLIYGAIYALLMSPWWLHNYIKYNTFVRLNLGDGYVLYSGNNPMNTSGGGVAYGRDYDNELDMTSFKSIKDPIVRNKALKSAAINYIFENPVKFLRLSWIKFIRFWRLWPHTGNYQQWYIIVASLLSYGTVLLLSILFTIAYLPSQFRVLVPLYLFSAYLTLVHMVTIASIRYRFPIEPFLVILAGYVLKCFLKKAEKCDEK